ncbi:MAG: glycosylasparaginase [Bacteroidetes bacterium]|nr:MAG: glycosylasparaginase [Bacteroidota bacterium]
MKRRNWIKLSALGVVAGAFPSGTARAGNWLSGEREVQGAQIISTWKHGMEANQGAWKSLKNGGEGLDAIEAGLKITESDRSNRSVGIGGMPDAEGHVTLDACIMNSDSRCGAVAYLEGIAHPISVARSIMEHTPHVMLVGEGARKYAISKGMEQMQAPLPEVQEKYEEWLKEQQAKKPEINHENHDTIGMLIRDAQGNIYGGCTTSGWAYKMPGRVGDSPIIGAGLFIDNEVGGAVATGLGEAIIRVAGSHTVVELMRQGCSPQEACKEAVNRIISKHSDMEGLQCGFLAINKKGTVGAYSVYNGFNFAYTDEKKHALIDAAHDRKW